MKNNRMGMSRGISPNSFKGENEEKLKMADLKAELMQESPCFSYGEAQFGRKVPANAKLYFAALKNNTKINTR